MTRPMLTFNDLAQGLNKFRDRYQAIDVFADDVSELVQANPIPGLSFDPENPNLGMFRSPDGQAYTFRLFPERGVLRFSKLKKEAPPQSGSAVAGALAGAAAGTILAAKNKKGEGAAVGLLLGLLVGAALESEAPASRPQRIFTMRFDPTSRKWLAYDGGLVVWAANELFVPST